MKRYNLTEDGFRAKFRHNQPEKGESPGQFLVRLTKYVDRWVDLSKTTRDYESLRDMFVREQFMEACPTDLATHLRERAPQSMKEMAEMAQHFLEAHRRELANRVDTVEFQNPWGYTKLSDRKSRYQGGEYNICGKGQSEPKPAKTCHPRT